MLTGVNTLLSIPPIPNGSILGSMLIFKDSYLHQSVLIWGERDFFLHGRELLAAYSPTSTYDLLVTVSAFACNVATALRQNAPFPRRSAEGMAEC